MPVSYEQFSGSLLFPPMRERIGLHLRDGDAERLRRDPELARAFYASWSEIHTDPAVVTRAVLRRRHPLAVGILAALVAVLTITVTLGVLSPPPYVSPLSAAEQSLVDDLRAIAGAGSSAQAVQVGVPTADTAKRDREILHGAEAICARDFTSPDVQEYSALEMTSTETTIDQARKLVARIVTYCKTNQPSTPAQGA